MLAIVGAAGGFSGCDAIESLDDKPEGYVTQQAPVAEQTGQASSTTRIERSDSIREMLIDPPEGEWPEPLPVLEWHTSLEEGWDAVHEDGRPLLILIRCPLSHRSGTLDQQLLTPTPALSKVLRQFVTVELTDGQDIDLKRMPFADYQDPDHTWWCWILSPQGQVYSVLGPETPASSASSESDVSDWLTRVLDHHWDPRRQKWNADGPVIPPEVPPLFVVQSPGYDRWRRGAEHLETLRNNGECMCCHQVQDVLWVEEDLKRQFRVTEDFWLWPPVEKTGLAFASETLPRVTAVSPRSFAAQARYQPEETIGIIDQKRIFSTTDVRAAVNSIRGPSGLKIYAAHDGQVVPSTLGLSTGAGRDYDLTWRASIRDSVLGGHPGFLPATASPRLRRDLRVGDRLALVPEVAEGTPAWDSGVRPNQVITKLGEISDDLTPEQFLFLFKLNNQVGSLATLMVRRGDANWRPAQLEIPSISVLDVPPEMLRPEAE